MELKCIKYFIAVLFSLALFILYTPQAVAQFVRGADISWLPQMEATGYIFCDTTGKQRDCLELLKDYGINSVRLRVWVNPSDDRISGHCSKKEVVMLAQRAKEKGMRIMINFHYSDSWADPGKQSKPAAWEKHTINQLINDVYNHTFEVVDTLRSVGVTPEWVQIGNEIIGGILWPEGSASNWDQLSQLLNSGYDAVKAVDPCIKVILHLDQGNNNSRFRYFFDNAQTYGVNYDIIGASYYPYWLGSDYSLTIEDLGANLGDMADRYGKEVMVVETGGEDILVQNTFDMLVAVIKKVQELPSKRGLGVIYWEPEGARSWSNYPLSSWNTDGKPTAALRAFLYPELAINNKLSEPKPWIFTGISGQVRIDLSGFKGITRLTVFDASGKTVKLNGIWNLTTSVIHATLLQGVYVAEIRCNEGAIREKFVVGQAGF